MSDEHDHARDEAAARAAAGMSPAARERLREANEAASDWKGTCRRCGAALVGTLAELRAHACEAPR